MMLGELINMLHVPLTLDQQIRMRVQQMQDASDEVREQALVSGAMPGEFRVLVTINRSNRFHTRFGAVLG